MSLQRLTRCALVLLLFCLQHTFLLAQTSIVVTGKVVNDVTKEPMRGVSVNLRGSNKGTTTDEQGNYSLTLAPGSGTVVLVFSYVGFDVREFKTNGSAPVNISMVSANKKLDDVVVIGYGTQKRSNILGAVATMRPKDVEDLPFANLSSALVNQVPGVSSNQTAGKPGATTNVSIRGAVSLNSGYTGPLYIIDGLAPIISTGTGVDASGKTAFDNLDPSQIESITFLKDASATIYGARGANGVILVTTKRGRPGKPRLSYAGSYSTENAAKLPQMLTGYDQALLLNNWVENYNPGKTVAGDIYTQADLDNLKAFNNNWFKGSWSPAHIQKHTVSVSGGSEKLTYFAGVNYYDEMGNLPDVTANKYGIQLGMTARILDNLTADIVINANNSANNRPAPKGTATAEQADQMNATIGGLLGVPGWVPEYYGAGALPVYYSPLNWHPAALAASGSYNKDQAFNFSLNASLEYKIPAIKGLSIKGQYGRNILSDYSKQYYVSYNTYVFPVTLGGHTNVNPNPNSAAPTGTQSIAYNTPYTSVRAITNGNQLSTFYTGSSNWQATEGIYYANRFGDHEIGATVLSEQYQTTGNYLATTNSTQVIPGIDQIFGFSQDGTALNLSGQSTSTGRVSYMGRLNYAFKGRYLLEGSFRNDASPNFPYDHQWGFFPSGSVGWKVSEENFFMNNIHFLNDLKIRLNVGLTGNDNTSAFGFIQRYSQANGYLYGSTYTNGLSTSQVANPDITWERALYKDLGIDGTFANRRFNFALDYWYKHQTDMLQPPTAVVPNIYGATIAATNYGIVNSWGTEAQIGYTQDITRDLRVFATVNFSWSDNKVIQQYYNLGTDTGYKNPIGKRKDLGISGYKSTGIVRTRDEVNAFYAKHPNWTINGDSLRPGDLNFEDINGDGIIDGLDQTQIAKRSNTIMGFGFNLGASWKGLRFSTNISLGIGGQMVSNKVDITPPTKDVSALSYWKNSYTAANPNSSLPAIYAPFANQASSFWLRSATYMYINNMQLSYQVPVSWTGPRHLPEIRAYVTGTNLWTLINPTPYKDPRSNQYTDYPILRAFTFGLNLNL